MLPAPGLPIPVDRNKVGAALAFPFVFYLFLLFFEIFYFSSDFSRFDLFRVFSDCFSFVLIFLFFTLAIYERMCSYFDSFTVTSKISIVNRREICSLFMSEIIFRNMVEWTDAGKIDIFRISEVVLEGQYVSKSVGNGL